APNYYFCNRSLVPSVVAPECGRACGETVLLTWLLGVSRGDTWLFLPDLVEVRDVGACVVRLWSHVVAPVFRIGYPYVALFARLTPPTLFRSSRYAPYGLHLSFYLWVAARPSGSLAGVREVASFPVGSECELQESAAAVAGCACFERVGIFARDKHMLVCHVALLVESCNTCLWLLPALCWLVVNSSEVLPEFFSIGSGGGLFRAYFASCCATSGLRLRSGDVFPEWLLALWVEVLPKLPCGREVGFVSRALWVLPDGSLVSAMGVWLIVPPVGGGGAGVAAGAVFRTVATFVAKVLPLLSYFEVEQVASLVRVVSCGAIAVLGGTYRPSVCGPPHLWCYERCLMLCASKSQYGGCALEAAGSPCVLLVWVSGSESLSVGLESFQAVGAIMYCTLSMFLWVAFGSFGACGGTLCSCSSGLFFVPSGALVHCVALWVAPVFEALSFLPLGHFALAMPCGCTITAIGWDLVVPADTALLAVVFSTCVFSAWFWVTIKKLSFGLAVVFLVGLVRAAPVDLLTSACVLCTIVMRPVVTVTWDPQPRVPVSEGVALGGGRAQVTDLEKKGKTTVLLTWLLGVSRGDTWLFLPNLVEVRDVGACVSSFASALLEFLLLWLVRDWLSLLSLVREAHPPYSLQVFGPVGGGTTFGVPGGGSGRSGHQTSSRSICYLKIVFKLIDHIWWRVIILNILLKLRTGHHTFSSYD
ncbi:hypothetical protein Taro_016070, partial [Colocasia esculenta]|nr:hypothetical protein [Colocasia esculenta]